ncbi:MAG: hypothetical protein LQ345_004227 [Seirophora villosa]|nr:MAG: hypothetical protein LQ345_004227 [Seirophora villosa]
MSPGVQVPNLKVLLMFCAAPLLRASQRRLASGVYFATRVGHQRPFSSKPDELASPNLLRRSRSGIKRLNSRLPRFLRRYTKPLIDAPITHITAFLVLHEVTAVIPLFGLFGLFHYTHWLPPYISEFKWFSNSMERAGGYLRKKGWLGEEDETRRLKWWDFSEMGVRSAVEFATAYAITKALLPLRIAFSVWASPWFARVTIVPSVNFVKRRFATKIKRSPESRAAGTGATAAGVLPQHGRKP